MYKIVSTSGTFSFRVAVDDHFYGPLEHDIVYIFVGNDFWLLPLAGLTGFQPVISSVTEKRGRADSPIAPRFLLLLRYLCLELLDDSLFG